MESEGTVVVLVGSGSSGSCGSGSGSCSFVVVVAVVVVVVVVVVAVVVMVVVVRSPCIILGGGGQSRHLPQSPAKHTKQMPMGGLITQLGVQAATVL